MIMTANISPTEPTDDAAGINYKLFGAQRARVAVFGAMALLAGWQTLFVVENDAASAEFLMEARRRLEAEQADLNDLIVALALKGGADVCRLGARRHERLRAETASEEAASALIALATEYLRQALGVEFVGLQHVTAELLEFARKQMEPSDAG